MYGQISTLGCNLSPSPPCIFNETHRSCLWLGRLMLMTCWGSCWSSLINSSLTAADHVSSLLASCSSLLYALCVLRSHGLPDQSLKDVFHATVIGKLMYCEPAWHGFCSASDYVRLDSFFTLLHEARLCKTISYCYRYVLGSRRRVVS